MTSNTVFVRSMENLIAWRRGDSRTMLSKISVAIALYWCSLRMTQWRSWRRVGDPVPRDDQFVVPGKGREVGLSRILVCLVWQEPHFPVLLVFRLASCREVVGSPVYDHFRRLPFSGNPHLD